MKIIFLHGLESTPQTSSTAKLIIDNFDNVIVPNYKPQDSYQNIVVNIKSVIDPNEDYIVIGISMGGFWALKLTEFTHIKKVILINPALENGCSKYSEYFEIDPDVMGSVIVNMDDDVVDNEWNIENYNSRFSFTTFSRGGHRVSNKDQVLTAIKNTVNFMSYWEP